MAIILRLAHQESAYHHKPNTTTLSSDTMDALRAVQPTVLKHQRHDPRIELKSTKYDCYLQHP